MQQRSNIFVVPRLYFMEMEGTELEKAFVSQFYVVSINGSMDTQAPFSKECLESGRILVLRFDDIQRKSSCKKLFSEDDARRIVEFNKRIPVGTDIFVHCAAGISRSGAVGEVLDMVRNDDPESFYEANPQIQPNAHVKALLMRAFDLTPQFAEEREKVVPELNKEYVD